jgi:hypothetical protein
MQRWLAAALAAACLACGGHAAHTARVAHREESAMPRTVRLTREQPGVVGTTATVLTIQDDTLRRQKLVNGKVVGESERRLSREEAQRVERVLLENDYRSIPSAGGRALQANVGRLVLEADGARAEAPSMLGSAPGPGAPVTAPDPRLQAIAEALEALPE